MGEIADMMLDGEMCENCGDYLGGGDGFPRYCGVCRPRGSKSPRAPVFRAMAADYDAFAKERRWLEAAAKSAGTDPDAAPSYLPKLAKRGFVKLVDDIGNCAYFITDAGRAELERIRVNS